ncbi:MAG: hypothetical protein U0Y68_24170 [Blastocatellia bacterium]
MKLLLPLKYVNEQDKRALWLYVALALLSAICLAAALFFAPDFLLGKKPDATPHRTVTPQPTARHRS